jgi:phosphocarrier protein
MTKKPQQPEVLKGVFTVANDRGLHTRPSAELVKCAAKFDADISLVYRKTKVNAKSLLGILMLAACKGSRIRIEASGKDAPQAIDGLILLASKNFNVDY